MRWKPSKIVGWEKETKLDGEQRNSMDLGHRKTTPVRIESRQMRGRKLGFENAWQRLQKIG